MENLPLELVSQDVRSLVARRGGRDSGRQGSIVKRPNLAGWFFVVLLTGLTEALVRGLDLEDSVATPSSTLRALGRELRSGTLSDALATTLQSYAEGFGLAIAGGVVLGLAIGS